MNHDSKHNDFEYEKENFPKTPEHFKQLVADQVAQEQQKNNISPIKSKKKWMPAKVAAVVIICATMGTTGAYAAIKQYQAKSQQYLQETGRITTPESSSEEETSATNGATVTVGESKTSASGTYLSLTWNFGKDKASYEQFDKIISGDTISNWIFCRITDSNGNTFDTKTDSETFASTYWSLEDSGDDHWNDSGETTYTDDDGNYCFQTNILLPSLTQDFTSLEITPYVHLEDGTETDLDFASFRIDYE